MDLHILVVGSCKYCQNCKYCKSCKYCSATQRGQCQRKYSWNFCPQWWWSQFQCGAAGCSGQFAGRHPPSVKFIKKYKKVEVLPYLLWRSVIAVVSHHEQYWYSWGMDYFFLSLSRFRHAYCYGGFLRNERTFRLVLQDLEMPRDKPPTGSLYPRESYVCFFIFLVELASVSHRGWC